MAGSIKNWPGLVKRIFEHLKPGGWAEFSEFDIDLKSQDNTIPKDYKPQEMLNFLATALDKIGRPIGMGSKLKGLVEDAGFTNIGYKTIQLPIGIWPKDEKLVRLPSSLYQFSLVVCPILQISNLQEDANI
jgi:Methyltransferase domain